MKNIILILVAVMFLAACNNNKTIEPIRTPEQLLTLNAWKLDRYVDANGKQLTTSSLNASALALFGLNIEFKENKETRAVDRITKSVLNRGTWAITDENVMDINITGFKGSFKIISLKKGKLVLQAGTGSFLTGVGTNINLEFLETL